MDSQILIVGAGIFGLSTALNLARKGYKNIKVIDRESIPSTFSAAYDLNKIVRAEYEDPFYTNLALDALEQWQTPFWNPYFSMTGYLLSTSANAPQKARDSLAKSFLSIENHPSFPTGSFIPLNSTSDIVAVAPQLNGPMSGWLGYLNKHAGYMHAKRALERAHGGCIELGVTFVTGDEGYAVEIEYSELSTGDGERKCSGIKTKSGIVHHADSFILCLGAHIGSLLPETGSQIIAKAWAVAHLQLSPDEAKAMAGIPVIMCRDLGFFFEPDPETGIIKLSSTGAGYTNNVSRGFSIPPVDASSKAGIPVEDEVLIRRLIEETMPQFKDRELFNKFICWCGDTSDSDYMIDYVPGIRNLIVVAGDSGHAAKMLPVCGKWVTKVMEEGEQSITRWKWKTVPLGDSDDISWRVGKVKDIKDVQRC